MKAGKKKVQGTYISIESIEAIKEEARGRDLLPTTVASEILEQGVKKLTERRLARGSKSKKSRSN